VNIEDTCRRLLAIKESSSRIESMKIDRMALSRRDGTAHLLVAFRDHTVMK
jgi:hypothetical protein